MSEPWPCGAGAGEGGGVKKQQMETRCWVLAEPRGCGTPSKPSAPPWHIHNVCYFIYYLCICVCYSAYSVCFLYNSSLCVHTHTQRIAGSWEQRDKLYGRVVGYKLHRGQSEIYKMCVCMRCSHAHIHVQIVALRHTQFPYKLNVFHTPVYVQRHFYTLFSKICDYILYTHVHALQIHIIYKHIYTFKVNILHINILISAFTCVCITIIIYLI